MRTMLALMVGMTMATAFAVGATALTLDSPNMQVGCGFPLPPCNPCPPDWTWYPEASMCCPPPGDVGPDCVQY